MASHISKMVLPAVISGTLEGIRTSIVKLLIRHSTVYAIKYPHLILLVSLTCSGIIP